MTPGLIPDAIAGEDDPSVLRGVLETAIAAGTVPGAVVLCGREGIVRFHQAFGARQLEPTRLPAHAFTVYDVASLTKAVCTSVLAMKAIAAGQMSLADRVQQHLPEFRGASKEIVTVRQLLCHASGLPAHRPLYQSIVPGAGAQGGQQAVGDVSSAQAIEVAAAREPLVNPPGTTSVYSDLGFILLGWIIERVTGAKLDVLFREQLAEPLGLLATAFIPLGGDGASVREAFLARNEVAPTERCGTRGRVVLGEVHDLNAFAMAGVAGHAGLFSDAADLNRIAAALVSAWQGVDAANAIVPRAIIQEFWRPAGIVAASTWRLGWDGPSARDSQAGTRLSRAAVGHLGFTGCSLWIDPARACWIVLLTNRIHPTVRDDPRFRRFRAAIHDAAVELLLHESKVSA